MKILKHEIILTILTLVFIIFSHIAYPHFQPHPNVCLPAPDKAEPYLVNINTATADELESIDGIGAALAHRIIEYRKQNGNFKTVDELCNVSGIGNSTLEQIKGYIKI